MVVQNSYLLSYNSYSASQDCCTLVQKCLLHGQAKGISRQAAVKLAANVLVRRVIDKGGADNVTVVVVDLKKEKRAL